MSELTFVTGNPLKFRNAAHVCSQYGIELIQKDLPIDEIQSEDAEHITRRKCQDAYDILQSALLVNDDSWIIPGLGGFPGPYMKSMNHWFSIADWARLTRSLTDRTVLLRQYVVFQDSRGQQRFISEVRGTLMPAPRGESDVSAQSIISLDGDNGKSIAEVLAADPHHYSERAASRVWNEFAKWHKANKS